MATYKVELLVRELSNGKLVAVYVSDDLELPFVPTVGMRFKQGTSTWLWETKTGELMPSVESVTYDLDESVFVCIFTVDQPLKSAFWTKTDGEDLTRSSYLPYFEARS
jgi:hypothetical protein